MNGELYFQDKQVAGRYGVERCTIWRWLRKGEFPAPVKLSRGCTRWRESDLLKWESERRPGGDA